MTDARRKSDTQTPRPRRPPATTPEARENQLIAAAVDLAEEQIRNGTASSQVITHYLKLGTTREKLEQERLRRENILLEKKSEALETGKHLEALFEEAIQAMRSYRGDEAPELEMPDDYSED
jgi:hypothetical protein